MSRSFKKIQCHTLSPNFRQATRVVTVQLTDPIDDQVTIRVLHVGINASDINFTNGKYLKDTRPPFDCGFEAVGTVVAIGPKCRRLKIGQHVAVSTYGLFAEYVNLSERLPLPVPSPSPATLTLLVSGLTASIALHRAGGLDILSLTSAPPPSQSTKRRVVLVTAAAGGTGLFAVQLAKLCGCHVIGTCSSDDKSAVLKQLGCDRVINYKKESLAGVLKKEYPKGLDIVYECVGGEFLDICVRALSVKGRLIIIGFMSGYKDGSGWSNATASGSALPWYAELLRKSASAVGFFLNDYTSDMKSHMTVLSALLASGRLQAMVDDGSTRGSAFRGVEQVADAIDYLYAGQNIGKVVVRIAETDSVSSRSKL